MLSTLFHALEYIFKTKAYPWVYVFVCRMKKVTEPLTIKKKATLIIWGRPDPVKHSSYRNYNLKRDWVQEPSVQIQLMP